MTVDVDIIHKYLLEHPKRGEVFPAWTDEQVLDIFEKSMLAGSCHIGLSKDNSRVFGVAITFPNYEVGYLYVTAFFADDKMFWPGVMRAMFEKFPHFHICGRIGGNIVKFDNAFLRRQFQDLSAN